jgi:N-acetylmuramoyl-L-alanine amidase
MSTYKWLLDAGHGGMTPSGVYTTAPAKMHVFDDGLTFYEGVNNRAIVARLIPMLEKAGIEYETVYDPVLDTPLRERVEKANAIHAGERRSDAAGARIFATDDTEIHGQADARGMATDAALATLGKSTSTRQQAKKRVLHYPCPSPSDRIVRAGVSSPPTQSSSTCAETASVDRSDGRGVAQKKSPGGCIYLSIHSDAMPDGVHGKGSGFSIYTSKGQTASDVIGQIFCGVYADNLKQFRFRQDRSDGDADMEEDFYVLRKTHCPALLVENLFFDNRREAEFLLSEEGRTAIADALFQAICFTEKSKPV